MLSAAIDRYVYVAINRTFTDDYFLKYSAIERVQRIEDIEHPIIREALRLHPIGPSIELVSVADIPAGTGLGSSGTFTVGLLRSIYAYMHQNVTAEQIAAEACHIEMDCSADQSESRISTRPPTAGSNASPSTRRCRRRPPPPRLDCNPSRPPGAPVYVLHWLLSKR